MYHQEQKVTIQQKVRISTEPLDPGMKRKPGPGQLLSDRRKTRGREQSDQSQRQSVHSSTPSSSFIANQEQQKMMVLSAEARQALIQMQRFDRFIYVMESEKRLKGPIQKQLKRLQKIKNSGNKSMKSTYYDNELTITCLFNHMKNMYEMNRDLGEIVVLKAEIETLQQKIIDQNVKYNKDIKQASTAAKGKFAEQSQQLKQTIKFHQNIISALKEVNLDRSKKKIEAEIKKYTEDKKELLELISSLVSRASAETSTAIIDTFTITIDKITQDQGDINKNLIYLEKERKAIQKMLNDQRIDEGKRKALEQLLDTALYITSIYGLAKSSEGTNTGSKVTTKIPQSPTRGQQPVLGDKKILKQLEQRLKLFQEDGNTWIIQFQTLTTRLEADQNITSDLGKFKKLLGVKKNIDPTISRFAQLFVSILELFNRKIRQQNQSSNAEKDRATQIQRLTKTNITLQKQIQQLKDQIGKSNKSSQKQPNVEAEWNKLITIVNEAFNKRQQGDPTAQGEINKLKKFIDLNRKKFPAQNHALLDTIEYLIRLIIESDNTTRQIQQQQLRKQQTEGKDIANFQTFSAGLEKLLTSGDTFNDGYLNKLKKNLEITFGKLQKLEQTPLLNLYLGSLDNTWKIVEILQRIHTTAKQSSKGKGETEIKKQDLDILRDQLKAKEQQLKTKDQQLKGKEQQLKTLRQESSTNQRKIKDYEKRIEQIERQSGDKKAQIQDQRKQKLKSQQSDKQVKALEKQIQRLQKQVQRLSRQKQSIGKQKEVVVVQYQKQVKKLNAQLQQSSNIKQLERENNELKKSVENLNRSVTDGKAKQVQRLRRQVQQLKSLQAAQQQSVRLKNQQIQTLKKRIKDLQKSKTEVKYIQSRIEPQESGQGSQYWRQRYQASKMQNQVLRDQLASLQRRFDQVYVGTTNLLNPQSYVKAQQNDLDLNRVKASLAKQEAIVLSQSLEIQKYRYQQSQFKNTIQNLNTQIRNAQMSVANRSKSVLIQKQISDLILENTKLQDEVISVKNQLNSTIDNLIFVDGQNFKITESFKKSEERCKVLENNINNLEKSIKSGLQVSKLKDQKINLENKNEELRRQLDIVVSELQTYKQKTTNKPSIRIPGTPKADKVVSSDWQTNSQVLNKESGRTQTKSQASFNNSERNKEFELMETISKLENQKKSLVERLGLLSTYNNSMPGVNQTFIDNVNKMVENLIRFMIDFEGVSQDLLIDKRSLTTIQKSLKKQDYARYFTLSEQYLRNAITAILTYKNNLVTTESVESREVIVQTTVIKSQGFDERLNVGSLDNLFKLYLKGKDPQLLGEIRQILSLRQ